MEDIESWLEKFEFVAEEGIPAKIDKKLILKQMRFNRLLSDEEMQKLKRGIIYRKGRIRIRLWNDKYNRAEVSLMDSGKIIDYIDFPVVNDESELTRESELKRMLDFCYSRYIKDRESERFIPLRYTVKEIDGTRGLAKICLEEDKEYYSEKVFWDERIIPLIRRYDNEIEIYMVLLGYSKSLEQDIEQSKNFKHKYLSRRLKTSIDSLLRMLKDKDLVVERAG